MSQGDGSGGAAAGGGGGGGEIQVQPHKVWTYDRNVIFLEKKHAIFFVVSLVLLTLCCLHSAAHLWPVPTAKALG